MATQEIPIVALQEMDWDLETTREFANLVEQRQLSKSKEDSHKRIREDLDKRIEAMLLLVAMPNGTTPKLQCGEYVVQRVTNSGASKLEPKRLLELGVSTSVIQQATVPGKPYSYILVK